VDGTHGRHILICMVPHAHPHQILRCGDGPVVAVIGGGHAGVEAACAAARALMAARDGSGADAAGSAGSSSPRVILVTMDASRIGTMSCNPAIGGLAKGQMVREVDALGGVMGLATDATSIQGKVLNSSKGAAVRGPRAQCDKMHYAAEIQRLIACGRPESGLITVIEGLVDSIDADRGRVRGVVLAPRACVVRHDPHAIEANIRAAALSRSRPDLATGWGSPESHALAACAPYGAGAERRPIADLRIACDACVLTTGTFMRALMHTGAQRTGGGRVGEGSAVAISGALGALGFELGRLKTGTPPRLRRASIDWDGLKPALGDDPPVPFSDLSGLPGSWTPRMAQVDCRETHTTAEVHDLVRANLHLAPMYSGAVDAECGPRYCPSLEDKVVRFAERSSHHVFLEPESLASDEVYCNGISTSLPAEVQLEMVRAMPGCARAEIVRAGYAVEYDMVWPHQIDATAETKSVRGLFLAGQINGTSGYEEAAGQGLIAGLNAARRALGADPVRLGREEAYIGVMMDDLVVRTPREPYRMFTSRAEHRLLLRADNADGRLTERGIGLGLVCGVRSAAWERRRARIAELHETLARLPAPASVGGGKRMSEIARRPDLGIAELAKMLSSAAGCAGTVGIDELALLERVVTDLRYEGYLARQRAEIRRHAASEHMEIPQTLEPASIAGLRKEAAETLARFRPVTLGQASRLAGMSPADVSVVALAVRRHRAASPRG
jgi:tRNA uridine 5-carboxymethylaminomethyl modification enzyme